MPNLNADQPSLPVSSVDATLRIEGPLVIATVADWHRRLLERLTTTPALVLDLGGITAVDLFGLQLLWSARRTAAARGQALTLTAVTPVFGEACAASGFLPSAFVTP